MNRVKRYISLIAVFILVLSVPQATFAVSEEPVAVPDNSTIVDLSGMDGDNAASDELLVLVEEGTTKKEVTGIAEDAGASLENISTLGDGTKLAKIGIDDEENTKEIAEEIASDEAVLIVQPNFIYHLEEGTEPEAAEDVSSATDETVPDEEGTESLDEASAEEANEGISDVPEAEAVEETADAEDAGDVSAETQAAGGVTYEQWYLGNTPGVNAKEAWKELTGTGETIVAVIDTGVDLGHGDLKESILTDKCVSFNNGKRGTFTQWDGADDDKGHGTHVCGLIAAKAGDNGIDGIAYNRAKLIVIDAALPNNYGFSSQDVILAIDYAVKNEAKVINISIGGLYKDYIQEKAISDAEAGGVLTVCAAGNETSDLPESPGDATAAISVMSHTGTGARSSFSNYGVYKDVSAPGSSIVSTYIGGTDGNDKYVTMSGTSMATPLVSGLAALIKSEDSKLNPREIKNYIYTSGGNRSFSGKSGFGMVNALNAIDSVNSDQADPDSVVLNSSALSLCPGEEFSLEYAVYPAAASEYADEMVFSTDDQSVASVDEQGVITAIGPGSAVVTAACKGAKAKCEVTVKDIDYTDITFPYSGTGAFTSDDHKLRMVRTYKGAPISYEALVKGYQIELEASSDPVVFTVASDGVIPSVNVFGPDGNKLRVTERSVSTSKSIVCMAYVTPTVSGIYKLRVLGDLIGEDPGQDGGIDYSLDINDGVNIAYASVSNVVSKTYNGKAHTQNPVVVYNNIVLQNGTDYTLTYSNNVKAGTAAMTIKGIGAFSGTKKVSFTIGKAVNGLSAVAKTYKIKRSKLKKKAKKVAVGNVMTVKGASGKVSYSKVSGNKKLSINASTGAITIKKKTKKGTYKMVVAVKAAGDANHYSSTKKVTVTVKVK